MLYGALRRGGPLALCCVLPFYAECDIVIGLKLNYNSICAECDIVIGLKLNYNSICAACDIITWFARSYEIIQRAEL